MVELSLVASAAFPRAIIHPEHQGPYKAPKEFQILLPVHGRKQDALRFGSVQFNAQHLQGVGRPMHLLPENNQSASLSLMIEKPVLIDMQDSCPDSVLFSFRIAEKCLRNEKILKFLMSGSKLTEGEGIDASLLSEVMGLQDVATGMSPHALVDDKSSLYEAEMDDCQHFLHLQKQNFAPEPQLDFVGNLSDTSYFTVHPDGRLLFADSASQMEDLLSIVADFNLPKRTIIGSKQSLLVPYFTRRGRGRSQAHKQVSSPTVATPKSSNDAKLKTLPKKKKNKKLGREQDLYPWTYLHACESLLSALIDKESSVTIPSLKKSSPEISKFLAQCSAGVAGTGLAVIFSVLCKLVCGRVPLSATRLLNTGFGFGLFWLSWAISGLRDTIIHVSKNSSKLNLTEEEIASKVKRSTKEIFFRAATLVAVAILRLA
ncbi:hypothetical protein MUK42_05088 [Musa troglodytarum]|uniref:Uncharacterized protein n=1 Tax=Musa troglodytarum TaxID=320322 RepID=A0A9E7EKQ2_9LILI|nr:hypothetical protein MUK42_05088 [Musa troglodytarum]